MHMNKLKYTDTVLYTLHISISNCVLGMSFYPIRFVIYCALSVLSRVTCLHLWPWVTSSTLYPTRYSLGIGWRESATSYLKMAGKWRESRQVGCTALVSRSLAGSCDRKLTWHHLSCKHHRRSKAVSKQLYWSKGKCRSEMIDYTLLTWAVCWSYVL